MKRAAYLGIGGGIALVLAVSILVGMSRRQLAQGTVSIDSDDLGGVVTSVHGPEPGIWVIAETRDLPTTCKGPLNGPSATGQHCPEGWTLYQTPGPQFKGVTDSGSADSNYYNWVDQFDTLGLGRNTPIATGNGSEALLALRPDTGEWVVMRVPSPIGFFAKGLDGRIDNARGGWKGKGIWTTYATRTPWHLEGGKGTTSKAVKFQLRPDPLAK